MVLSFDEMKIQEDLLFNKHSCLLLSFTDLGDVSNTFVYMDSWTPVIATCR